MRITVMGYCLNDFAVNRDSCYLQAFPGFFYCLVVTATDQWVQVSGDFYLFSEKGMISKTHGVYVRACQQ